MSSIQETKDLLFELLSEVVIADVGPHRFKIPVDLTGDRSKDRAMLQDYFKSLSSPGAIRPTIIAPKEVTRGKRKVFSNFEGTVDYVLERLPHVVEPSASDISGDVIASTYMAQVIEKLRTFAVVNETYADDALKMIWHDIENVLSDVDAAPRDVPAVGTIPASLANVFLIPEGRGGGIGKGEIGLCVLHRNAKPAGDAASMTAVVDLVDNKGEMSVKYIDNAKSPAKISAKDEFYEAMRSHELKDYLSELSSMPNINNKTFKTATIKTFERFKGEFSTVEELREVLKETLNEIVRNIHGDITYDYVFVDPKGYRRFPSNDNKITFNSTTQDKVVINYSNRIGVAGFDSKDEASRGSSDTPQQEVSMGGVAGVTTPLGTGPDGGKGGPAARRKGKRGESTLDRNARTQGRGFGNAKRVDEASVTTGGVGTYGYMDGTDSGMDLDGDGDGDIRSSPKGADSPIFRGGGGDLERNAEQIGHHFAGASPIRDFHELVGILLGGDDLTPAQRARFKGTAPSSKAGEFWKPHRGTKR